MGGPLELSFVVSALRRYWWVFVGSVVLCSAAGAVMRGETQTVYESNSLMFISPPSDSLANAGGSSDRYVAGQLLVLGSESSAAAVAEALGDGSTAQSILSVLTVAQATSSDIVQLTISADSPERSQLIAKTYVEQYFGDLQSQLDVTRNTTLRGIDAQLAALQTQLDDIDARISAAMEPYLPPVGASNASSYPPIPPIEQVVPELVSQKQTLLGQYSNVSAAKTQLEVGSQVRVTSQVVQPPTLPTTALVSSNRKILVGGVLAGAFLGLVLSVFVARVSRRVLDEEEASELVGVPLVGAVPSFRTSSDRRSALEYLAPVASPFFDHLRVRVDALDRRHQALVVVVTGTETCVGTTTLAAALANRFAVNGAEVIVVDADSLHPELTELFERDDASVPSPSGRSEPSSKSQPKPLRHNRSAAPVTKQAPKPSAARTATPTRVSLGGSGVPLDSVRDALRRTRVPGLHVVAGSDLASGGGALRREDVPRILDALDSLADVIIIDGGPFLSAASTVQFTHMADAAVLAIPIGRQGKQALSLIAGQLREQQANVLPVSTPRFKHTTR